MINEDSLAVVNKGIIGAAAGGAAVVIVAIMMFATGLFHVPGQQLPTGELGAGEQSTIKEVSITLNSVNITHIDEEKATIEVSFDAFNPNRNTMILEEIQYSVMADGVMLAQSSIGERLTGMVSGTGHTYYVVSNLPLTLKGTVELKKTNSLSTIWGDLQSKSVEWSVKGKYVITDPVRMGGQEKDFDFTK